MERSLEKYGGLLFSLSINCVGVNFSPLHHCHHHYYHHHHHQNREDPLKASVKHRVSIFKSFLLLIVLLLFLSLFFFFLWVCFPTILPIDILKLTLIIFSDPSCNHFGLHGEYEKSLAIKIAVKVANLATLFWWSSARPKC